VNEAGNIVPTLWKAVRHSVWGIAAALLPSPHRDRIVRREGLNAAGWSGFLGLLELGVGFGLYILGYLACVGAVGAEHQWILLANWGPKLTGTDLMYSGIFAFIGWHMRPEAWLWSFIALTGALRCVTFLAVKEPVAEPVVALAMWAGGTLTRRARERKRLMELGPERPDSLIYEPEGLDCDLLVVSCRDKPSWNRRLTIEVRDRYYRLLDRQDRWKGTRRVACFLLREVPDEEVVRGFVSYLQDPLNPD